MPNKPPLEFRFAVRKTDYPVLYEHLHAYSDKVRGTELCLLATRGVANKLAGGYRPGEARAIPVEALDPALPIRFKLKESDFSELFLHLEIFSVKTPGFPANHYPGTHPAARFCGCATVTRPGRSRSICHALRGWFAGKWPFFWGRSVPDSA